MSWHRGPRIDPRAWELLRRQVFRAAGYRCRNCGKAARLEADHIRPLWKGGAALDVENVQALCRQCHVEKTADENGGVSPAQRAERDAWRALVAEIAES